VFYASADYISTTFDVEPMSRRSTHTGWMRVLVVEDHAALAGRIAQGLRQAGLAVDAVFDGAAALQAAAQTSYEVIVHQPVFPDLTQERLRTAIARACKASGTPTWSPHDLRHRRISLWHRQGEPWALIGARVGQRSLSVTADTYTHVLLDDRELDHTRLVSALGIARV
jgi:integrase